MALFSDFNINKKLGAFALLLGIIALIIGNPSKSDQITLDTDNIAAILNDNSDLIDPQEIADWIIQGRIDYILVDIRNEKDYEKYHIPGAVNQNINKLKEAELPRNEKIILYSDDPTATAQAWIMLTGLNYKQVFRIKDGLEGWNTKVRNPDLKSDASPEEYEKFEKKKVIARYFGGNPTINGKEIEEGEESIQVSKPVLTNTQMPATKKKPKKEGC